MGYTSLAHNFLLMQPMKSATNSGRDVLLTDRSSIQSAHIVCHRNVTCISIKVQWPVQAALQTNDCISPISSLTARLAFTSSLSEAWYTHSYYVFIVLNMSGTHVPLFIRLFVLPWLGVANSTDMLVKRHVNY